VNPARLLGAGSKSISDESHGSSAAGILSMVVVNRAKVDFGDNEAQ